MKKLFIIPLLTILLLFNSNPSFADIAKPKLYITTFYADWCAPCKILGKNMDEARAKEQWTISEAEFIKLDLTNAVKIQQTIEFAKRKGVYPALKGNGAKTGSAAIVDSNTGQELDRLYSSDTPKQIIAKINKALE